MKRFSECGVEGVEVDQVVRGDSVEGQNASRTVHIDCYSTGGGGGGGQRDVFSIMPDIVTTSTRAAAIDKIPWPPTPAKIISVFIF